MSIPEQNGTNGQGPALKLNLDEDSRWEPIGGVHYTKIGDHDNQSAARLAARLAGVHPTVLMKMLHHRA